VTPEGKGRLISRARAGFDRRVSGLSHKLSIVSALLLCTTPLLLVHASSPARVDNTAPANETPASGPPPAATPGIEIVRTRPVTTATAPPATPSPQPQAQQPAAKTAPAAEPATKTPAAASPAPAADPAPPATWSEAEITAARQQCGVLLDPLKVTVQELPPLKQDKCGTPAPVALKKLGPAAGGVELSPAATLNCAMVARLDAFVEKTLQPAAREVFGSPVVKFNQASGYVCRGRNGDLTVNGKLSEHALANALDVASFTLADGRVIDVGKHWGPAARDFKTVPHTAVAQAPQQPGSGRSALGLPPPATPAATKATPPDPAATRTKEALFLRRLHQGACALFGTVLGPEANEAHREHFHFDLHPRRASNYCQ
jgi:hypothetical protein